jgi:CRP/FNR family transcriptional regulator, cyclic AMP receptor protein
MDDILSAFVSLPILDYAPGELMVGEGSRSGKLLVLIKGEVEVIRRGTNVTHIDEPGAIFGEMSVLLDMPHSAMVTAMSNVKVYEIKNAIDFLRENSAVSLHLAALLARRLYYTTSYLVDVQNEVKDKRENVDFIDRILSALFQFPDLKKQKSRLGR